jgi:hypothetical protein
VKIVTCFGFGQLCEGPMSSYFQGTRRNFRLNGKIPSVHTMDLYVDLLLDHFYTLYPSRSCMGMLFLVQNFTQLPKKFRSSCCIFPVSEKAFTKFWKFWKYFATFGHRKKRKEKGGTSFCTCLTLLNLLYIVKSWT